MAAPALHSLLLQPDMCDKVCQPTHLLDIQDWPIHVGLEVDAKEAEFIRKCVQRDLSTAVRQLRCVCGVARAVRRECNEVVVIQEGLSNTGAAQRNPARNTSAQSLHARVSHTHGVCDYISICRAGGRPGRGCI